MVKQAVIFGIQLDALEFGVTKHGLFAQSKSAETVVVDYFCVHGFVCFVHK
jgi:hypothetical protein